MKERERDRRLLYGASPQMNAPKIPGPIGGTEVKKLPEKNKMGLKGPSPNSIDYLSRYRKMMEAQKRNAAPDFPSAPIDRGSFLS